MRQSFIQPSQVEICQATSPLRFSLFGPFVLLTSATGVVIYYSVL